MKKFVSLLVIVFFSIVVNAQFKKLKEPWNYYHYSPTKDKLLINFDNGEKLEITYTWSTIFQKSDSLFKKYFWNDFETMLTIIKSKTPELNLDENKKYHIIVEKDIEKHIYSSDKQDAIKSPTFTLKVTHRTNIDNSLEYKIQDGEFIAKTSWQTILDIKSILWSAKIYINKIESIDSIPQNDIYKLLRNAVNPFFDNKLYQYHTILKYKLSKHKSTLIGTNYMSTSTFIGLGPHSSIKRPQYLAIKLYPMIGTSIIKSKMSADAGVILGASFNDRMQSNLRLGIRYQIKGFGENTISGTSMNYYGFVDGIMDLNIGEDYKKQKWVGAGIGYMAHSNGDLFGKNTLRVFFKYRSSKLWGIQPEYYYSFRNKESIFGIALFFSL